MVHFEIFTSAGEIPEKVWDRFTCRSAVGLEINHLKAVEDSGINNIKPYYLIGFEGRKPVGIAYCFSIELNLARMSGSYPEEILKTVKTWKPDFMDIRIIEAGHIASLGRTIEFLEAHRTEFLDKLAVEFDKIAQIEKAELGIIRDISTGDYSRFRPFEEHGYKPAAGFPVARLPLKWSGFDSYLDSLKSKRRNNIRQRLKKMEAPEIQVDIIENYAAHAERLAELWKNVAQNNNGYEHEKLCPEFFESMSQNLNGRNHVVAIRQAGKIVAYGLNLIGDDEYFGVAEGLDYEVRDQYDLYANNIFESLRVACSLGKKTFNIGITSYDFKTSIGAELDQYVYLVKAFRQPAYTSVYTDFFKKLVKQPNTPHHPFPAN